MAGLDSTTNAPGAVLNPLSSQLTYMFRPGFVETLDAALEDGLWNRLPKIRATGADIRPKFHYARNTGGGATTETGTVGTAGAQRVIDGRHPFFIYTKPIEVTDFAQAQSIAAGHSGYESWADEVIRAGEDMRQDLEKALWTAQTGNNMHGVPDYVDDGSNTATIWGLSRNEHPWLKSIHLEAGGTDRLLTLLLLRQAHRQVLHGTGADLAGTTSTHFAEDQGGGIVSIWATTPEIEQVYESLLVTGQRYPLPTNRNTGIDPGQTDLIYKRAPIVASKYAPDNILFGMDLRNWHIEVLPQQLVLPTGTRMETDFALVLEGRVGQKIKGFWRIYCELVCTNPHRNVRLADIKHDET